MDFLLYIKLCTLIAVTNSYVLLTANIDEFKDLAKKIVPRKFADELTDIFFKRLLNASVQTGQATESAKFRAETKNIVRNREPPSFVPFFHERDIPKTTTAVVHFRQIDDEPDDQLKTPVRQFAAIGQQTIDNSQSYKGNNENNGIDIEALAEKVSELLMKKYNINLVTTTHSVRKRKKATSHNIRQPRGRASKIRIQHRQNTNPTVHTSTQNTLSTNNLQAESLLGSPVNRPQPRISNRGAENNPEGNSNRIKHNNQHNQVLYQPTHYQMFHESSHLPKAKQFIRATTKNVSPSDYIDKLNEKVDALSFKQANIHEHETKSQRLQRGPPTKKKYRNLHIISQFHKGTYETTTTNSKTTTKANIANPQEYEVVEEYGYNEDRQDNPKERIQNARSETTKETIIEPENQSTSEPHNKNYMNYGDHYKPGQNFYLKTSKQEPTSKNAIFKGDLESTETLVLGFLAPKQTDPPKQNTDALLDFVDLNKHDSYEDYQAPKKADNIFSSNEKPKTNKKHNASNLTIYDYYEEGYQHTEEIKAVTMSIGQWYDEGAPSSTLKNNAFILSKNSMATLFNYRSRYTTSTRNYLSGLPKKAEKYDFAEPLPEKDRVTEKIVFVGDPAQSVNNKIKINRY